MKRAILFDITHTLITTVSNEIFPRQGVKEGLTYYYNQVPRWELIGISNQDDVAIGNKSIEDAIAEMKYTLKLLPQLSAIYFCPDFEGQVCWIVKKNGFEFLVSDLDTRISDFENLILEGNKVYRKPGAGMIYRAANDFEIDLTSSWMVGDREEDEAAAQAANINFMWADVWRMRFTPGMYEVKQATPQQMEFLEGARISENLVNLPEISSLLQPPDLN